MNEGTCTPRMSMSPDTYVGGLYQSGHQCRCPVRVWTPMSVGCTSPDTNVGGLYESGHHYVKLRAAVSGCLWQLQLRLKALLSMLSDRVRTSILDVIETPQFARTSTRSWHVVIRAIEFPCSFRVNSI